ncbi:MAG: TonB-dependent receptor [Acidobacteria bacterium]|nr:TonB-dependent receptor [Acidobacteriota bacterium]
MTHIKFLLSACLCLWFCIVPATAQVTSSAITGTVRDESHHPVSQTALTVKNLETGLTRKTVSADDGSFSIFGLPPGRYSVQAEKSGFTEARLDELVTSVAEEKSIHLILKVIPVQEVVTITGEPSLIEVSTSTISGLVTDRQVPALPLNGRDLTQLILLQPGVVNSRASVQSGSTGQGARFSVSGARPTQNVFTLDGTVINDALNNTPGSAQGLLIGVEAVKEFRVLVNNYGAEYSRAAGGVFLAVTKSGSNDFHGSVFEFLRNDIFDARNFFDKEKPAFRRNQFGAAVGGPIVKNKAFFFANFEALRERKGITRIAIVPDASARMGILPGANPISIDPRAVPILDLYPQANGTQLSRGTAEFIGTTNRFSDANFLTSRFDINLSDRDSLFGTYTIEDSQQLLPRNFPEFPNLSDNRKHYLTLEEKHVFSPTILNEARFGFVRTSPSELVPETDRTLQLIAGQGLGEINVSGLTDIGTDRTNPKIFRLNHFQFTDNLIMTFGRHTLKVGGNVSRLQYNGQSESRTRGQLRFRSLADLLAFKVREIQGASADSDFIRGLRQTLVGFYLQDNVRLTDRLTLNLGLRYETVTTPKEVNGKIANLRDISDPEVTVGGDYFTLTRNNFAPRVGLAWDVTGRGKTIVRSGFGMFYDQPLFQTYRNAIFRTLPFVNRGVISSVPMLPVNPGAFKGADLATEAIQHDLRPSYVMQYNLNIQQDFKGMVVQVAYLGSRGVNLFGQGDVNTAFPQRLPDGREFFPEGSKRRNPKFGEVRRIFQGFNSHYHAVSVNAQQRLRYGLDFQLAYTYGKSIDERSGVAGRLEFSNGQSRAFDPYNRKLDRGLSDFDVRHSFTTNLIYQLPKIATTNPLLSNLLNGWQVSAIISLQSGVPYSPVLIGDQDQDGTDANVSRPDVVPGVSFTPSKGQTSTQWFNLTAFTPPQPGVRGNAGRNILTGPNYKSLDLALTKEFFTDRRVRLQFRAEFFNLLNRTNFDIPSNSEEGEALYTFIPADDDIPASFQPSSSAGKIFSTSGNSRELQFALKLVF